MSAIHRSRMKACALLVAAPLASAALPDMPWRPSGTSTFRSRGSTFRGPGRKTPVLEPTAAHEALRVRGDYNVAPQNLKPAPVRAPL